MASAPAVQLSFQLRTSPNVRSVHLLGSWDNYQRQLPLSMLKDDSAKPGSWKGTFRFQGSQTLKLGGRYWYYYIVDGYHVSHDPAKEHVTEKTTGRKLNVLNVPGGPTAKAAAVSGNKPAARPGLTVQTQNLTTSSTTKRHSREVVQGRGVDPTQIVCPRPQKPYASRTIREADYELSPIDDLEERFASSRISNSSDRSRHHYLSSPSSLSDSSSGPEFSDPGSSVSASSRSRFPAECRCGRYGITKDGRRVKLDCGGSRCRSGDSSASECSSNASDSDDEYARLQARKRLQANVRMATRPSQQTSSTTTRSRPVIVERRP